MLVLVVVAAVSFFLGYKVAYDKIEDVAREREFESQTFYATVTEITDRYFSVMGMEVNDINYRGEFTFPIMKETTYQWRGTEIAPSELQIGSHISITFVGEIRASYPAQIANVTKVQLLDDKN